MPSLLNEQIAALRKERGFTQERLGQMLGVSAQAVSKWEKGGAPDVELLPALADALGVTIDALFGREEGTQTDVKKAVGRWLDTFPREEQLDCFCRLFWASLPHLIEKAVLPEMNYLDTASKKGSGYSKKLTLAQCQLGGGIFLNVHAEDLSFVTLWPKPKDGYAKWLAPKEEYRRLFELLARPGCLDLLWYIHHRKFNSFSAAAAAKQLNMSCEDVERLLDALAERQIVSAKDAELEDGEIRIYQVDEPFAFIPFFYIARCFMQRGMNYMMMNNEVPFLRPDETWAETEED